MYQTMNFRRNPGVSFAGSTNSTNSVLADLYDKDGRFYRSAVVADFTGVKGMGLERFCRDMNYKYRIPNCFSDLPY